MLDGRRRAGDRRFTLAAVVVAMVASLSMVAWQRLDRPAPTAARLDAGAIRAVSPSTTRPEPPMTTTLPEPAPEPEPETVAVPGSTLRRGLARPVSLPATVADVRGARIGVYSAPEQDAPDETFKNPTWEGLPLVFLVQQRQGEWLEVQLNTRPNQTTGWIRAADVSLREVTRRVVVSLASRSLTVYEGEAPVMSAPVAIGTASTPTPRGNYFIDGAVQTPDPGGVYGPFQVSVAAFSEVLMSFGTGVGQIAFHGTNAPGLVGSPVSNGCLRMTNADITRLANMVDIGTPVQIT